MLRLAQTGASMLLFSMKNIDLINELTKAAYNNAAAKYHELFHNEMNEKEYDRILLDSFASKLKSNSSVCDAGCGPSGHIGKYLFDKGHLITGIDISEICIELASIYNPQLTYICADIGNMPFDNNSYDAVISYYSIINTPKFFIPKIFSEFYRVLKPGGYLLVAVKTGEEEGIVDKLLGYKTRHYFSLFSDEEIKEFFNNTGFKLVFFEKRNPYDFEINNERIFAIGKK